MSQAGEDLWNSTGGNTRVCTWGRPGDKNTMVVMGEDIYSLICWCFAILVRGDQSGGCTGTSTTVNSFPVDSSAAFTPSCQPWLLASSPVRSSGWPQRPRLCWLLFGTRGQVWQDLRVWVMMAGSRLARSRGGPSTVPNEAQQETRGTGHAWSRAVDVPQAWLSTGRAVPAELWDPRCLHTPHFVNLFFFKCRQYEIPNRLNLGWKSKFIFLLSIAKPVLEASLRGVQHHFREVCWAGSLWAYKAFLRRGVTHRGLQPPWAPALAPMLLKNCVQTTKSLISLQCCIFPAPYNFGNGIWTIYCVLNLGRPKMFAYKYVWFPKNVKWAENNKYNFGPKQRSSILKSKSFKLIYICGDRRTFFLTKANLPLLITNRINADTPVRWGMNSKCDNGTYLLCRKCHVCNEL